MRPIERASTSALAVALALSAAGCRPNEASILLRFPNAEARRALVRLEVEVFDPSTGLGALGGASCGLYLGRAAAGRDRLGEPLRASYTCETDASGVCPEGWLEDQRALDVPREASIVYVLGFASPDPEATPFLEGCTDRLAPAEGRHDRVPVELEVVLPESARLVPSGVGRFVGAPGATPSTGLVVRAEAEDPVFARTTYGIPGVVVALSPSGGAGLAGVGRSPPFIITGPDGRASAGIVLPDRPGVGFVDARAAAIEAASPQRRGTVRFVASALSRPELVGSSVDVDGVGRPVAMAIAPLASGAPPSLVVLGCEGATPESCDATGSAQPPFGRARLAVLEGVGSTPRRVEVEPVDLGILPVDVVVGPFVTPGGATVALLDARRADCQSRVCLDPETCPCWTAQSGTPCPCEGAEIRFLELQAGRMRLTARLALTASNALGVEPYALDGAPAPRLAVVARGRDRNDRPCAMGDRCLAYDGPSCRADPTSCGCPPEESCRCPGCPASAAVGICGIQDAMFDLVDASPRAGPLNLLGCRRRVVGCDKTDPRARSTCACLDASPTSATCTAIDDCGCRVPFRSVVGGGGTGSRPSGAAAGRFEVGRGEQLVSATDAGLQVHRSGPSPGLRPGELPFVNTPVEAVVRLGLDPEVERATSGADVDDLAWIAPGRCTDGLAFREQCPIVQALADARGCFGVYASDGLEALFEPTRRGARCRRFELPARPGGLCSGDFDGNGADDVAITLVELRSVLVYLGDGWGGLLEAPLELSLPRDAAVGPIACGDTDGDGADEILVADAEGRVTLFRRRP